MRTLFLVAALTLSATAAAAHPKLLSSSPAAGATVAAPKEVRMSFSEGLIAKLSGLEIKTKAGAAVKTGATSLAPKDSKQLVTPVAATLEPGQYTVAWHAVSTDTHRVQGQFDFTVK